MRGPRPGNFGAETAFEVRSCDADISVDEYLQLPKHPLTVVLDNLRSAFNVGSIYRIADTARLEAVVTCGYTAHPPHLKLDKTALGALDYVGTEHHADALTAVDALHQRSIPVWGVETTSASKLYTSVSFPQPVALVVGNEALGVTPEVLARCDELIEIPMFGFKNSLNVAAATAVVVFEALRQWDAAASPRPEPGSRRG
jgi:23S rRNA (guanosine2251-2'-O)-methyltransferase